MIKKLTPIEQEKYKQDFYTKLINSSSIEGFLQKLSMKLKDTDLDEMTRKFELFTKLGILPLINISFDNSGGAQFEFMESPTFYGQFQCSVNNLFAKKVDDLVKIRNYLALHTNLVRFEQKACAIPFLSGAGQASPRPLAEIFFD